MWYFAFAALLANTALGNYTAVLDTHCGDVVNDPAECFMDWYYGAGYRWWLYPGEECGDVSEYVGFGDVPLLWYDEENPPDMDCPTFNTDLWYPYDVDVIEDDQFGSYIFYELNFTNNLGRPLIGFPQFGGICYEFVPAGPYEQYSAGLYILQTNNNAQGFINAEMMNQLGVFMYQSLFNSSLSAVIYTNDVTGSETMDWVYDENNFMGQALNPWFSSVLNGDVVKEVIDGEIGSYMDGNSGEDIEDVIYTTTMTPEGVVDLPGVGFLGYVDSQSTNVYMDDARAYDFQLVPFHNRNNAVRVNKHDAVGNWDISGDITVYVKFWRRAAYNYLNICGDWGWFCLLDDVYFDQCTSTYVTNRSHYIEITFAYDGQAAFTNWNYDITNRTTTHYIMSDSNYVTVGTGITASDFNAGTNNNLPNFLR